MRGGAVEPRARRLDDNRLAVRRRSNGRFSGGVAATGAVMPSSWRLEVANVLRNAVRRGRCDELYVDRSLDRLSRLRVTVDAETDSRAWSTTRTLAREQGLTLYDAAYLDLAIRLSLPLACRDRAVTVP